MDSICISEAEKTAVLTLIREEVLKQTHTLSLSHTHTHTHRALFITDVFSQIITKEVEASDWKRKHEESRQEVHEMRYLGIF